MACLYVQYTSSISYVTVIYMNGLFLLKKMKRRRNKGVIKTHLKAL